MEVLPMKIERPDTQAIQRAQRVEGVRASSAAQPAKPVAGAAGPDRAEFSAQALELAKARAALANVPEVRAEKVADLRQQVQSGEYQPPVEKLARRLSALL
jgi:negative regulator of flagellin synthesis FlgM